MTALKLVLYLIATPLAVAEVIFATWAIASSLLLRRPALETRSMIMAVLALGISYGILLHWSQAFAVVTVSACALLGLCIALVQYRAHRWDQKRAKGSLR